MSIRKFVCVGSVSAANLIEVSLEDEDTKEVLNAVLHVRAGKTHTRELGIAALHAMAKFAGKPTIQETSFGKGFLATNNHLKGWHVRARVQAGKVASFLPFQGSDSFQPYGDESPTVEDGKDVWLSVEKADLFGVTLSPPPQAATGRAGPAQTTTTQTTPQPPQVDGNKYVIDDPNRQNKGPVDGPLGATGLPALKKRVKDAGGPTAMQKLLFTRLIRTIRKGGDKGMTLDAMGASAGLSGCDMSGPALLMASSGFLEQKSDGLWYEGDQAEGKIEAWIAAKAIDTSMGEIDLEGLWAPVRRSS